jgi:hypothetical protein
VLWIVVVIGIEIAVMGIYVGVMLTCELLLDVTLEKYGGRFNAFNEMSVVCPTVPVGDFITALIVWYWVPFQLFVV